MAANVELLNRAWAVITDTLSPGVKKVDRQKNSNRIIKFLKFSQNM